MYLALSHSKERVCMGWARAAQTRVAGRGALSKSCTRRTNSAIVYSVEKNYCIVKLKKMQSTK